MFSLSMLNLSPGLVHLREMTESRNAVGTLCRCGGIRSLLWLSWFPHDDSQFSSLIMPGVKPVIWRLPASHIPDMDGSWLKSLKEKQLSKRKSVMLLFFYFFFRGKHWALEYSTTRIPNSGSKVKDEKQHVSLSLSVIFLRELYKGLG